jgi:hypothetical protein
MTELKRGALGESTPLMASNGLLGGNHPQHKESPPTAQAIIKWRDHLRVHPAAEIFPLMSETDPTALKELADDIQRNGLQTAIVPWAASSDKPDGSEVELCQVDANPGAIVKAARLKKRRRHASGKSPSEKYTAIRIRDNDLFAEERGAGNAS